MPAAPSHPVQVAGGGGGGGRNTESLFATVGNGGPPKNAAAGAADFAKHGLDGRRGREEGAIKVHRLNSAMANKKKSFFLAGEETKMGFNFYSRREKKQDFRKS